MNNAHPQDDPFARWIFRAMLVLWILAIVAAVLSAPPLAVGDSHNPFRAVPTCVQGRNPFSDASEESPAAESKPALRVAYETEVRNLAKLRAELQNEMTSPEAIARVLHKARRDLGVKYKSLTPPDLLSEIYQRNREVYDDPLGPTVDWLRGNGKTWEEIADSASQPGDWPLKRGKPVAEKKENKIQWKPGKPTGDGKELVYFGATWCAACPPAKKRIREYAPRIYHCDFDAEKELAKRYHVTTLPCVVLIQDGEYKNQCVGHSVGALIISRWLGEKPPSQSTEPEFNTTTTRTFTLPARVPGPTWNWPGDLRKHLREVHGYNAPPGVSHSQLIREHDNRHNAASRIGVVYSSCPTCR